MSDIPALVYTQMLAGLTKCSEWEDENLDEHLSLDVISNFLPPEIFENEIKVFNPEYGNNNLIYYHKSDDSSIVFICLDWAGGPKGVNSVFYDVMFAGYFNNARSYLSTYPLGRGSDSHANTAGMIRFLSILNDWNIS